MHSLFRRFALCFAIALAGLAHATELAEILADPTMIEDRGLGDYGDELGFAFLERLHELGPGDLWIDFGCGQAEAVKDYLLHPPSRLGIKTSPTVGSLAAKASVLCIGVGAIKTDARVRQIEALERQLGRVKFHRLTGLLFHQIPPGVIASLADNKRRVLVSNVRGILTYTDDFRRDFEQLMNDVPLGSVLAFELNRENFRVTDPTTGHARAAKLADVEEIFGTNPGLELVGASGYFLFQITVRKILPKVTLPVKMTAYEDARPAVPERAFLIGECPVKLGAPP